MKVIFIYGMLLNSCRPPQHSVYCAKLYFPFVGNQYVNLMIKQKKIAHIKLNGIINIEDDIKYDIDDDGKIDFKFSLRIEEVLKKYYCEISDARYYDSDYASIKIKIKPLRFTKHVSLYRSNCEFSDLHNTN